MQLEINSTKAYSQIKQWLNCCQTHDEYHETPIGALPTRVIEVTPVDSPETPRVLTTQDIKGQYLTLSYCWGQRQSYVLTTANLQSCLQGLDVSKLARTIRDAIEVTKNPSFKHLWVDALCVIQDSERSEIRELAVMDRTYKESSLTIVAASAVSANAGFLRVRKNSERKTFTIPCRLGQDKFDSISIQEHEQYDDLREPVNKRAWTLQEQSLSP